MAISTPGLASAGEAAASGTASPASQVVPPTGRLETSGITTSARHPGVVWLVEDGALDDDDRSVTRAYEEGGAAGEVVATITLDPEVWNNRDTEAVARGPDGRLWITDIGDNCARGGSGCTARETVVVHAVPEPRRLDDVTVLPESFRIRYPDGPRDAETFLVDPETGRAYVASKSLVGSGSLYALPTELVDGETHDVELVGTVPSWATDGAFTPDGRHVVLLVAPGAGTALPLAPEAVVLAVTRDGGGVVGLDEVGRVALPELRQAEALTTSLDGRSVLVTGEGPDQPVWSVPLPAALVDAGSYPTAPPTVGSPPPAPPPLASGPVVAGSVPGGPGAGGGGADDDDAEGCRWSDPPSCLQEPFGWVAAAVVLALGLLVGGLAVLRRGTPRRSGRER